MKTVGFSQLHGLSAAAGLARFLPPACNDELGCRSKLLDGAFTMKGTSAPLRRVQALNFGDSSLWTPLAERLRAVADHLLISPRPENRASVLQYPNLPISPN